MILQAPNGQHFTFTLPSYGGITPAPIQASQVFIQSITFDMVAHTFVVQYGIGTGGGLQQSWSSASGGFNATLEAALQGAIETAEGWTAGTSTIVTP